MHSLKYVNASNVSVQLNDEQHAWTNLDALRKYAWEYTTSRRPSGKGGKASGFGRWPKELTFKSAITATTRSELEQWVDNFHSVTEPDIYANTAGRLYIDDQYMTCFITGADTESYNAVGCYAIVNFTVAAVEPYWCTEVLYTFSADEQQGEEEEDTTGKKYDGRYPYRYGTSIRNTKLQNNHYTECPAIITIYGPCEDPYVTIDGIMRQVFVNLLASERLVINSVEQTINKVNSSGVQTNVFNLRNKAYDIFSPVPAGEVSFYYNGDFKLDVLLVQQRSMPRWKN